MQRFFFYAIWPILAVLLSVSSLAATMVEIPGGFQDLGPGISEDEFRATGRTERDPTVPRVLPWRLRTCQLNVKPGDISGSYTDPVTGTLTFVALPRPNDSFDQLLLSYNIALCSRLDRKEISKEDFQSLLKAMIAGIIEEKRKLAIELRKQAKQLQREKHRQQVEKQRQQVDKERQEIEKQRLLIERQRLATEQQAIRVQQDATQAHREATIIQRKAIEAQREATLAQQNATAVYNAYQNYWAIWAQNFQHQMRSPIHCTARHLGYSTNIDCY